MVAARLEPVLVNLLSNAVNYSDPAKAERFAEARRALVSAGRRAFKLSDHGRRGAPGDANRTGRQYKSCGTPG